MQAADLRKAAGRKGQSLLAQVDVLEARRILQAVSDPARRGALRSVFAGDCVVRSMTKKWQGQDGKCTCGLEAETRGHVFWECPNTKGCRASQEAGTSHQLLAPEGMERELGLPLRVPEVEAWREAWTAPPQEPAAVWKAEHLYVDASCRQPKLSSIRTVGWAVVDGKGHTRGGVLPPGSTVALGESRAIIEAYGHCEAGSVIWSDCQAAVKLWRSCQRPSAKRYAGALLEVLPAFAEAKRRMPGVQVFWVPSHLTCAEFEAKGHPRHAWSGNNAADEAAKERARVAIAPDELVARVQAQRARAKEVAHVVASAAPATAATHSDGGRGSSEGSEAQGSSGAEAPARGRGEEGLSACGGHAWSQSARPPHAGHPGKHHGGGGQRFVAGGGRDRRVS